MNKNKLVNNSTNLGVKKSVANTKKSALQDITNKIQNASKANISEDKQKLKRRILDNFTKNEEKIKKEITEDKSTTRIPVKDNSNLSTKVKIKRRSQSAEAVRKNTNNETASHSSSTCLEKNLRIHNKKDTDHKIFSPIRRNIHAESYYYIGINALKTPKVKRKQPDIFDIHDLEYLDDIYLYLKNKEKSFLISKTKIELFPMNFKNRDGIVNWMVSIQPYLRFHEDELFIAVQMFDFCLTHCNVALNMMQLLGVTCLWISIKFNSYSIQSNQILKLCGHVYEQRQLYSLERKVLKMLNYVVPSVQPLDFVGYYLLQFGFKWNIKVQLAAQFLLESLLLDKYFFAYPISLSAFICTFYAIKRVTPHLVNNKMMTILKQFDRYKRKNVEALIEKQLQKFLSSRYIWNKIFEKYKHKSKMCIANYFVD